MKKRFVVFPLALALLVACQANNPPPEPLDFTDVDTLLQNSLADLGGGCVLLLTQDGQTIYEKAFGNLTISSVVPIASGSKWLSAAVIMGLVDQGKLSLATKTSDLLPSFTGEKGNITVRQLFAHTSGLPTYHDAVFQTDITLAEAVEIISGVDLDYAPGTVFRYGGVSMHVGGRMAEVAGGLALPSGQAWEELFAQVVARPLGMTSTDYQGLGATDNPVMASSVRTSARDYRRFLEMLRNDGMYLSTRILSAASVAEILKDQTGGVPIYYTPYDEFLGLDPNLALMRYGLGNWRERFNSITGAALESSSQGAYGFSPWIDFQRNLTGVLLVDASWETVMPVYLDLKPLIRQILDQ